MCPESTGPRELPLSHSYGLLVTIAAMHIAEPGVAVLLRWFTRAAAWPDRRAPAPTRGDGSHDVAAAARRSRWRTTISPRCGTSPPAELHWRRRSRPSSQARSVGLGPPGLRIDRDRCVDLHQSGRPGAAWLGRPAGAGLTECGSSTTRKRVADRARSARSACARPALCGATGTRRSPPPRPCARAGYTPATSVTPTRGLPVHRRPQEGSDHPRRLQRLSPRCGGCPARAPRGRVGRRGRPSGPRHGEEVVAFVSLRRGPRSSPTS